MQNTTDNTEAVTAEQVTEIGGISVKDIIAHKFEGVAFLGTLLSRIDTTWIRKALFQSAEVELAKIEAEHKAWIKGRNVEYLAGNVGVSRETISEVTEGLHIVLSEASSSTLYGVARLISERSNGSAEVAKVVDFIRGVARTKE